MPRFPDFYCIGSQKAATTWLYRCLAKHPAVHVSPYKEVHYFDSLYVDFHRKIHSARAKTARAYFESLQEKYPSAWARGRHNLFLSPKARNSERRMRWWLEQEQQTIDDAWFSRVFSGATTRQKIVDVTPAYAVLPPRGIKHLHELNPKAKLLLIVRNPVERAYSHAKMLLSKSGKSLSNEHLIEYGTSPLVSSRDNFPEILENWRSNFSDQQFSVAFYDEICAQPHTFLKRICLAIDIPYKKRYFLRASRRVYRGTPLPMSNIVRDELSQFYSQQTASLQRLYPRETESWT